MTGSSLFNENFKMEKKCKNCLLFNRKNKICQVTFIIDGEDYVISTNPEDDCHIESNGLIEDLKTLKVWSDGSDGYIQENS
jgi:hypothetical protein